MDFIVEEDRLIMCYKNEIRVINLMDNKLSSQFRVEDSILRVTFDYQDNGLYVLTERNLSHWDMVSKSIIKTYFFRESIHDPDNQTRIFLDWKKRVCICSLIHSVIFFKIPDLTLIKEAIYGD